MRPEGRDARPAQPLVLRREAFGGILFDPVDGTHLELDAGGFEVVRGWLVDGREPTAPDALDFVASVRREMPTLGSGARRVRARLELPALPQARHATVLGAPTLVDLQVTRRCTMGCPQCYAASEPEGAHMALPDAARVLGEVAAAGTCQLAIGGGEPLLHPDIVPILDLAHELGLVPNLTTTGLGLTPRVLDALARSCGAVALSLEDVGAGFALRRKAGFAFFEAALAKLRAHAVRTVFQVTLSGENLPRLPAIVDYCLAVPELYGVIFLAHKPVGRGEGYDTPLSAVHPDELYPWLREAFLRLVGHTKVGYDCCLTPGIAGLDVELGFGEREQLEGCSAARSSVGVSTDLDVVPCTFLTHRPLGNLRSRSLLDIWQGPEATAFRAELDALGDGRAACRTCRLRDACLGGCPEWDLVRCTRDG
ncbi:MAG: radical SAM protein [Polyangiaceae bacterium]|nr:radical SAM protein [Polyangiaceae bacterium]